MQLSDTDMTQLFELHSDDLLRFFARRLFDSQAAIDLVGETFACAVEARQKFEGERLGDARPWLFGIARNLLSHYYRDGAIEQRAMERLNFERVELSAADLEQIDEFARLDDVRSVIRDALDRLSDEHREVLILRIVDRREYASIAQQVGVSEQTVRARVSRGLRQLRKVLEESGDWEALETYG